MNLFPQSLRENGGGYDHWPVVDAEDRVVGLLNMAPPRCNAMTSGTVAEHADSSNASTP
jgi:hypothetical protein